MKIIKIKKFKCAHPWIPQRLYGSQNFITCHFHRDDNEWLQHRQIMNEFLLKDAKWTEQLIEMTCDSFTSKIKRIADSEDAHLIDNLEDELHLWSIYCKLHSASLNSKKISFQLQQFWIWCSVRRRRSRAIESLMQKFGNLFRS
jgi:hypothetical protein